LECKVGVRVSFYKDDIAIIELSGELSIFSEGFELLSKELNAYIKMGIYKYILLMERLRYIDSSGVGLLIRISSFAAKKNTKVCLICHQPNILKILNISKVDIFFKPVESVDEAISYFENV
jgi:anti-sigma B factor antagonist